METVMPIETTEPIETVKKNRPLTRKQKKFVELYAQNPGISNTKIAIQAGYKANSLAVRNVASENLAKPGIITAIETERERIMAKTGVTQAYFVDQVKGLLERCTQAEPVRDAKGEATGEWRFDSAGANGALEKIAKWLGAYEIDNRQKAGSVSLQIATFLEGQTE